MHSNPSKQRYYDKGRQIVIDGKKKPCADCGIEYPYYIMQYDHRDSSSKLFHVGLSKSKGHKLLLDEIAKCDVVCANCHAERTYQRRLNLSL